MVSIQKMSSIDSFVLRKARFVHKIFILLSRSLPFGKLIFMNPEFKNLNEEDSLKAENEFLKMKMMLEHGAHFGGSGNKELSPQLENEFLNYVMEFEKQAANPTYIKVFDKIARPTHFKPVTSIPELEIEKELDALINYLNGYGINLSVCSPNITTRELYRFTTEELFQHEMSDMSIPGYTTEFIYDEFHPDPVYDNTRAATEDCINYILEKDPLEWTHHFEDNNLCINEHYPLTVEELKKIVNQYKDAYDSIEVIEILAENCEVNEGNSIVNGNYSVEVFAGIEKHLLSGKWKVASRRYDEYWYITEIFIEGIDF